MMMPKNINEHFYPCYLDIAKARSDLAFGFSAINGKGEVLTKLIAHLKSVEELKVIFSPDKIEELANRYYEYYDKIMDTLTFADSYLNNKGVIVPSAEQFCAQWENDIFVLYEKCRIAASTSVFEGILYGMILLGMLWNPRLDPRNPLIKQANLLNIAAYINGKAVVTLEESAVIDTIKAKFSKYKFDIDEEGTILIKKNYEADLPRYFANAAKMMKLYKDSRNIEKIKLELAKIHYINELIENKYLYNDKLTDQEKADYKKFMDLRARILSSFKLYVSYVLTQDKEFDFNSYYENSPYNKVLSVDREQVRGIKKLISTIVG